MSLQTAFVRLQTGLDSCQVGAFTYERNDFVSRAIISGRCYPEGMSTQMLVQNQEHIRQQLAALFQNALKQNQFSDQTLKSRRLMSESTPLQKASEKLPGDVSIFKNIIKLLDLDLGDSGVIFYAPKDEALYEVIDKLRKLSDTEAQQKFADFFLNLIIASPYTEGEPGYKSLAGSTKVGCDTPKIPILSKATDKTAYVDYDGKSVEGQVYKESPYTFIVVDTVFLPCPSESSPSSYPDSAQLYSPPPVYAPQPYDDGVKPSPTPPDVYTAPSPSPYEPKSPKEPTPATQLKYPAPDSPKVPPYSPEIAPKIEEIVAPSVQEQTKQDGESKKQSCALNITDIIIKSKEPTPQIFLKLLSSIEFNTCEGLTVFMPEDKIFVELVKDALENDRKNAVQKIFELVLNSIIPEDYDSIKFVGKTLAASAENLSCKEIVSPVHLRITDGKAAFDYNGQAYYGKAFTKEKVTVITVDVLLLPCILNAPPADKLTPVVPDAPESPYKPLPTLPPSPAYSPPTPEKEPVAVPEPPKESPPTKAPEKSPPPPTPSPPPPPPPPSPAKESYPTPPPPAKEPSPPPPSPPAKESYPTPPPPTKASSPTPSPSAYNPPAPPKEQQLKVEAPPTHSFFDNPSKPIEDFTKHIPPPSPSYQIYPESSDQNYPAPPSVYAPPPISKADYIYSVLPENAGLYKSLLEYLEFPIDQLTEDITIFVPSTGAFQPYLDSIKDESDKDRQTKLSELIQNTIILKAISDSGTLTEKTILAENIDKVSCKEPKYPTVTAVAGDQATISIGDKPIDGKIYKSGKITFIVADNTFAPC